MSRSGFYSDYGIGLESVYGTAVAVTKLIDKVTDFSLQPNPEKSDDETLRGFAGREPRILGLTKIQGGLVAYGSFGETELLRAIAIGGSNLAGGGPPFVHTHDPTNQLTRSVTLVKRLKDAGGNEIREFSGVKVQSWKFSAAAGEPFVDEFELVAKNFTTSSVTNTDTEMDTATAFGAVRQVFRPSDIVVRLANNADALAAGDVINSTNIELLVTNGMALEDFGSDGLAEPARDEFRDITLNLTLPRLDSTAFRTFANANTELQCDIVISRGGDKYEIRLPALTLGNPGDVVSGSGLIRPTLDLVAHRAKGNNPTFPTLQEDIQVILTSTSLLTADILP